MTNGVSQVLVLGPLLCVMYIHDLDKLVNIVSKFGVDTKIGSIVNNKDTEVHPPRPHAPRIEDSKT